MPALPFRRKGRPKPPGHDVVLALIRAGDLQAAGDAITEISPASARTWLQGRLDEQRADQAAPVDRPPLWREAARNYEAAIESDPDRAETHFRLGLIRERLKQWQEAATAFDRAVTLDGTRATWFHRLAWMHERLGDKARARTAYAAALDLSPDAPAFARSLLDDEVTDFLYRGRIAQFVSEHLDEIRERASLVRRDDTLGVPVFAFWAQGWESAPAVVRTCLHALQAQVPRLDLHLLTESSVPHYVALPERVLALASRDRAHYSDCLRAALLARYGGVWIDATCLPGPDFAGALSEVTASDYFAFRYRGARISSWFMAASPASYIAALVTSALTVYWEIETSKQGYFMYHHVFEALYRADETMRRLWDDGLSLPSEVPHRLQRRMYESMPRPELDAVLAESFVHKLSWKLKHDRLTPDSALSVLVRQWASSGAAAPGLAR